MASVLVVFLLPQPAGARFVVTSGSSNEVIKMIDGMTATLEKEQHDDEHKKEYCAKQVAKSEVIPSICCILQNSFATSKSYVKTIKM